MNGRQAARAAAARIEELEYANGIYRVEVKAYNRVIDGLIDGKSPCPWCNDYGECQREEKDQRGCTDWFLALGGEKAPVPEEIPGEAEPEPDGLKLEAVE